MKLFDGIRKNINNIEAKEEVKKEKIIHFNEMLRDTSVSNDELIEYVKSQMEEYLDGYTTGMVSAISVEPENNINYRAFIFGVTGKDGVMSVFYAPRCCLTINLGKPNPIGSDFLFFRFKNLLDGEINEGYENRVFRIQ